MDKKRVAALNGLLSAFDQDYAAAFAKIVAFVKETQSLTVKHLATITQSVNDAVARLEQKNSTQVAELQSQLTEAINQRAADIEASHAEAVRKIDAAVANIRDGSDGLDGKDADEELIVSRVLAAVPPQDVAEDIRNKLELLEGDERLDKSAIKGLEELEKRVNTSPTVIGNNPGIMLADTTGNLGRFQTIKFPGATITTSNVDASITLAGGGGTGTVTSVSVTTANGVSGTVANPTTTPAISLALGDITPTSVAASGTVTGSNLSGTNTGDQVISDATLATTDITTNNVSITKHGFVPKAPNSTTQFLRGDGTWATPAAGSSGITRTVASISANTTAGAVASIDYVYLVTGTTTLTLPTAVGNTNQYTAKNVSGATTVATTSAQTINGSSTVTIGVGSTLTFISDNSNWHVV